MHKKVFVEISDGMMRWRFLMGWFKFPKTFKLNERRRLHDELIIKIEYGNFMSLVISDNGGMSRQCKNFYKSRLAEMIISKKYQLQYYYKKKKQYVFSQTKLVGICLCGNYSITSTDSLETSLSGDEYTSEFVSNF